MEKIKNLKRISTRSEYDLVCQELDRLLTGDPTPHAAHIVRLTDLIHQWDETNNPAEEAADPVVLLRMLMVEHQMRNTDMADLLGLTKGAMSNILSYRRDLTREHIRILASHFAISQESLNKPYDLKPDSRSPKGRFRSLEV